MKKRSVLVPIGFLGLQFGIGVACALLAYVAGADVDRTLLAGLGGVLAFWALGLFALVGFSVVKVVKGSRTGDYS